MGSRSLNSARPLLRRAVRAVASAREACYLLFCATLPISAAVRTRVDDALTPRHTRRKTRSVGSAELERRDTGRHRKPAQLIDVIVDPQRCSRNVGSPHGGPRRLPDLQLGAIGRPEIVSDRKCLALVAFYRSILRALQRRAHESVPSRMPNWPSTSLRSGCGRPVSAQSRKQNFRVRLRASASVDTQTAIASRT